MRSFAPCPTRATLSGPHYLMFISQACYALRPDTNTLLGTKTTYMRVLLSMIVPREWCASTVRSVEYPRSRLHVHPLYFSL